MDTGDKAQVKKRKKSVRLSNLRRNEALRAVLETPQGREVAWAVLEQCGIYRNSFMGEQPLTMAFLEGKRGVGTWFLDWCFTSSPGSYTLMRSEAARREADEQRSDAE